MKYVAKIEHGTMSIEPFGNYWQCFHSFKSSSGHWSQWFPTVRQCKEYGAGEYKWWCRQFPLNATPPKRITWKPTPLQEQEKGGV